MSCACCNPSLEDRLRQLFRLMKRIPGAQNGWSEIRKADDDWAEVGKETASLLSDLFDIYVDEMVDIEKVAKEIYESEPAVKDWVDWEHIVNDPANSKLYTKYMNHARAAVHWGIK
jgi:hypothetical protein